MFRRRDEYVRRPVHTAGIHSVWSRLERGAVATFHNASREYLPSCLNEIGLWHNNRKRGHIFELVVLGC